MSIPRETNTSWIVVPPLESHGQVNASPLERIEYEAAHSLLHFRGDRELPQLVHGGRNEEPQRLIHSFGHRDTLLSGLSRRSRVRRATQACDQCRVRKVRCDEKGPRCTHCEEYDLSCVYKMPTYKKDRELQQLLDRIRKLGESFEERLSSVEDAQVKHSFLVMKLNPGATLREQPLQYLRKGNLPGTFENRTLSQGGNDSNINPGADTLSSNQVFVTGRNSQLAFPVEFITTAERLLIWPSIREFLPEGYDDDYVTELEESHGLIRAYGSGEGDETSETPKALTTSTDLSTAVGEQYMYHPSIREPWGGINQPQSKLADNGLDDAGWVTVGPSVIRRYLNSYMEHLYKFHPFLCDTEIQWNVERFITTYCPSTEDQKQKSGKRRRLCDARQDTGCYAGSAVTIRPGSGLRRVEKSIDNAIVLLVLALGSICEVRDRPVPGPIVDHIIDLREERIPQTPGTLSRSVLPPGERDLIVASQIDRFRSHFMDNGRKSTIIGNHDVIPGLAFYAYAASILGIFQGVNSLQHVQAALLAGLYSGQLAHPFQSYGWISQAARACQVLVRSQRYREMRDGAVKDLYNFAYWTCFQLESEILAQLNLPNSGISLYRDDVLLPSGRFTLNQRDITTVTRMMSLYSAQIFLQKTLYHVHTELYKVEEHDQGYWSSTKVDILSSILEQWRSILPDFLRWEDGDPPSDDIKVANMRSEYYSARYLIYRPILYYVLHLARQPKVPVSGAVKSCSKSQQVALSITQSQSATSMARLSSEVRPALNPPPSDQAGGEGPYTYRELPSELRHACKICIDSAILSTEAFDGINGRPVVTNIFGMGHAYAETPFK
ncbi:C6 finger domain protein [Aspergillus niger]|nr:C6 finger domain protein [Aspergillus niger]